jgi:hypothetical protein
VRKNIEILKYCWRKIKKPKEGLFYGFCKIREANTSSLSLLIIAKHVFENNRIN